MAFTLSEEGTLLDTPSVTKSSNFKLDPYALEALKQALPFPHFPKDLVTKIKRFNITLVY